MLVLFTIFDRATLLPYFLKYYTQLGATHFKCQVSGGQANPLYPSIASYCDAYKLELAEPGPWDLDSEWYCIADLDEFQFFGGKTLPQIVALAQENGFDAIHGKFVDRIASDGSFPDIEGSLDERFPLGSSLTYASGLCCDKIVVARSTVRLVPGQHSAKNGRVWYDQAKVHHFKWSKGILEVMKKKYERTTKAGHFWAANQLKLIQFIENGIDVTDQRLRIRVPPRIGI